MGGLASNGNGWVACRPGFFLPVRVLSRYFRRVLLAALQDAFESGELRFAGRLQTLSDPRRFAEHLRPARETEWVVYAKRPFAGPEQVLDDLGRYTHRIAISNQRLCSLHDDSVRFRYTDYRRSEEVIVPISIRGRSAPDSRSARKPEVLTLDDLDAPVISLPSLTDTHSASRPGTAGPQAVMTAWSWMERPAKEPAGRCAP